MSDNIAELTRATYCDLSVNAFVEIPLSVLAMTQLKWLDVSRSPPPRSPADALVLS